MSRRILVSGATGKQGGALINALVKSSDSSSKFDLIAVTRDPNSASARRLAAKSSAIKLIKGDMDDAEGIFSEAQKTHGPIWGVFSVQTAMGKGQTVEKEEVQGKAMIDAAVKAKVQHFVYTSVDRGGLEKSFDNPTYIPHFASKHRIEQHLLNAAKSASMDYTILRPVAFMDNWVPGMAGEIFGAALKAMMGDDGKVQFIATADIGRAAAQAFLSPEKYKNLAVGLAGDDVSFRDINEIFKEKKGYRAPATFVLVGHMVNAAIKEFGLMLKWFKEEGYGVDIAAVKRDQPDLLSFGEWLETESSFK